MLNTSEWDEEKIHFYSPFHSFSNNSSSPPPFCSVTSSLEKNTQPDCASYVCARASVYKHNGGCLLGLKQDCAFMCMCIYVYNGPDSWPAVNVCNKAEQAKWWKTPGVWDLAGDAGIRERKGERERGWENERVRESVCVSLCVCLWGRSEQ